MRVSCVLVEAVHTRDIGPGQSPIAWGLINVYKKKSGSITNEKTVDYGKADRETFDQMLRSVDEGELTTSLLCLEFASDRRPDIVVSQDSLNDIRLKGIIPFKIIHVCHRKVEPLPNFRACMMPLIEKFFIDVNK